MVTGYAQTDIINRRAEGKSASEDKEEYLQARIRALENELNKYKHISNARIELFDENDVSSVQATAKKVVIKLNDDGVADILIYDK